MQIEEDLLKGRYFPENSHERRQSISINLLLLLSSMIMVLDVYGSIMHGYGLMSWIEGTAAFILLVTYLLFYRVISLEHTTKIAVGIVSFTIVSALIVPGYNEVFALFWLGTLPILLFFFLEIESAVRWSFFIVIALFLLSLNALIDLFPSLYAFDFLLLLTIGYGAFSSLVYISEKKRYGFEKQLIEAAKEKELLYRELNHRVKNNLLMILSLVKLQIARTPSEQTKNELLATKNRINSLSSLYKFLHRENQVYKIDTYTYFTNIIDTIKPLASQKITIDLAIAYQLNQKHLLYTGLILNELVTNAFKYAFDTEGELSVSLYREEEYIHLIIQDNGRGYDHKAKESLGLVIVKTLVMKQLFGTIDIHSDRGTRYQIRWKE